MLAYSFHRSQIGPCGHYLPDSTAAEAEYAYEAEAVRCHACTAVAAATPQYKDNPNPQALLFRALRRR